MVQSFIYLNFIWCKMGMYKKRKNQVGGGLLELLVVSVVVSIFLFSMTNNISRMDIQTLYVQQKLDYVNFQNEITTAFRNDSSCLNNLTTNAVVLPAGSLNLTSVKFYDSSNADVGTVVSGIGAPLNLNSRISVASMTLNNVRTLVANREYIADLLVTVSHTMPLPPFKPFTLETIRIYTSAGGVPLSCNSSVKVACVTGFLAATGYSVFAAGGTIKSNSDPTIAPLFSNVFNIISSPPKWGMQCKAPQ